MEKEEEEEELYIPNTNCKLKFMPPTNRPPDKYFIELLNRLKESHQERKKEKFQRWLNTRSDDYK